MAATDFLKALDPRIARSSLRTRHHNYLFDRAVKALASDPDQWIYTTSPVLREMRKGWENDGWSAKTEYLVACLRHALNAEGPILECGSGLTTIAMGVIAAAQGSSVWSLEHMAEWGERVGQKLRQHQIDSVRQLISPLKDYSEFTWYDPPLETMPDFSLVICDGPPSHTPGGRYGLIPVMKSKLRPGARILLDDAVRDEEKTIAQRWAEELRADYQILGTDAPYILLTMPADQAAS